MTEPEEQTAVESTEAPQKENPETFVLRASPARAIRFRKSIVILIAASAILGIAAATWFAFEPNANHHIAAQDDSNIIARPTADTLNGLPSSYADAPRLGPSLPGDLGQPILDHQRAQTTTDGSARDIFNDQHSARDTAETQIQSARISGLMVKTDGDGNHQPSAAVQSAVPTPTAASDTASLDSKHDPNGQQRKAYFVASLDTKSDLNPYSVEQPPSPYLLSAGSVISASLITGLRSDLPGLVIAQVTDRVYDSPTGHLLLIPQGARLIGSYDSVVAFGQRRALIVWQRIIFPDGRSLRIDNVPATDPSGYAGLADKVDFHSWTLLKGAALSTLLGVGANLTFTGESDLVQAIRESTQQNVSRAGDQLTSRNLRIRPTITIRPGTPVRLVVHHDLILPPQPKGN